MFSRFRCGIAGNSSIDLDVLEWVFVLQNNMYKSRSSSVDLLGQVEVLCWVCVTSVSVHLNHSWLKVTEHLTDRNLPVFTPGTKVRTVARPNVTPSTHVNYNTTALSLCPNPTSALTLAENFQSYSVSLQKLLLQF